MAALSTLPQLNMDSSYGVDKLTYEIFSILENKFLFGYGDPNPKVSNPEKSHGNLISSTNRSAAGSNGKVRILSIDGGGTTDGILAADSLSRLEASLRLKSGNPSAVIADYFDVVAGSGAGGILAAMLFTRGRDGGPLFTAEEALKFLVKNRRKIFRSSPAGFFRRVLRSSATADKLFGKVFGDSTLRDTLKSVLIPCYDLSTGAPFLFSRADAFEMDGYDFKMRDVCTATSADPTAAGAFEMRSVDQRTKILAVDGGIAMNNPTSAAITHVLNNKQEFPLCNGVEDLLVVSLGNGESEFGAGNVTSSPTAARLLRIAGEGASDLVDQAVSMAFGDCRTTNYIRIQGNGIKSNNNNSEKAKISNKKKIDMLRETEFMLTQNNVESVLFQGKRIVGSSNVEKIDVFASELVKEQERRKTSFLPMVALKQMSPSPRTSSATTLSSLSST
ncbi:patatin-like protein 3 [Humulus lupulus]|uniref:patatin-like protein 3 n=1 Tax=Humulus lupulus TaxID=3486 RepID=UPI002B402B2E|nr:patatin-like protein 3 [Humulus lupulus]